jgi:hypothetical protein
LVQAVICVALVVSGYNSVMRYRLRTLLILMAILPPAIAGTWFTAETAIAAHRRRYACSEHLKQIGLVLRTYSSVFYTPPPGASWGGGTYPAELPAQPLSPVE